ncbi:hypothetical protein HTS88_15640 [Pseudarthrobacter oxydans]|uniref:hypothetical protein n=1 Tax=Pseudarthrobacter oxydans TaxID=1671 RepID=UPI001572976D|nr:hypothetical protein [Pseudarthrobacter oxydans]NSX37816.1 hypothetical protein [Pseudarthrobacter oxydans]
MSKQKHDIGNKKRRAAEASKEAPKHTSTDALAHRLVTRGLATKRILDHLVPAGDRQP